MTTSHSDQRTSDERRADDIAELEEMAELEPSILTSNDRGKHSELLAATDLLANGYSVLEPISPQPYDLAIRHPQTGESSYIQIKTAFMRDEPRYGGAYIVVRGARNNGKVYTMGEVDYFVAVWDGEVYLFPNREKSEYWIRPKDLSTKWTHLMRDIE